MKAQMLFILLLPFAIPRPMPAAEAQPAEPQRIRIGVDIRLSYKSCIDYWTPITNHLSHAMPAYRFVVVPLASHQDLVHLLETGGIDFMSLDPAMELMAEDRFGAAPLASMVESPQDATISSPSDAACSGAIIRRADRMNMKTIKDVRGQRVSAVKPWSLTGWIAQWGLLVKQSINPQNDLKQVSFLGTHGDVIKSVLDGTVEVGVVDADLLYLFGKNQRIPNGSLYVFNQQGNAVPLVSGTLTASTNAYPGRLVSKAAATSDELAKRVADVLMQKPLNTSLDGMPCTIRWTVPSNTSKVRRLLYGLMGPHFAESPGYPLPHEYPAWFYPALIICAIFAGAVVLILIVRSRYVRRRDMLEDQLQTTRKELAAVRAERQRINTILTLAGCGIDIIDDHNRIVFADSSLERKYGDWRGKKCHGYFCNSDAPCSGCKMPSPADEQRQQVLDLNGSDLSYTDDPHAKVHFIEGESTRMIGIPFHDEGGRWLYARIHFPLTAFAEKAERSLNGSSW
jgi:ABC-type phosphate/phosphonate transport system substrate-binding protein